MSKARRLLIGTALTLGTLAAVATVAVIGFIDDQQLPVMGKGSLKGAVQLAQSHAIFPRGNGARSLPSLVSERSALLIYVPNTSDDEIQSLKVTGMRGTESLGTIEMAPPSQFPSSDQTNVQDKRVEYATKAWSAVLPWDWVKPGLQLTIRSNRGQQQTLANMEFSAPSELILQHMRIGMLTAPPAPTHLETRMAEAATDYFQRIPTSRLVVSQYLPVQLNRIVLPDGTIYDVASKGNGGMYDGDMNELIGQALLTHGINMANFGISDSSGSSQEQPGFFSQVVAYHSVGRYANGVQAHGMLGGNNQALLIDSDGNEFSHEMGHVFGLGHYPNGYEGSVHSRQSGWGYDAYRHRTIGNLAWGQSSAQFVDGREVEKFADQPYGFDAMAGGSPQGSISRYTQHTGFAARWIQKALASYGTVDLNTSTGYRKWNPQTQSMEVLHDAARRKPATEGKPVMTLVGYYDPARSLPSTIYPPMFGSYGVTYESEDVTLANNPNSCRLLVEGNNGAKFITKLRGKRISPNEMNKFHVNVPLSFPASNAAVQCVKSGKWETLNKLAIEKPANFVPRVVKIGGQNGFSAMANSSTMTLNDTLQPTQLPISQSELRQTVATNFGPIQTWKLNDTNAVMGRVYEYANPFSGQYEYFLLKTDGIYTNFPTDQRSSFQWRFLGGSQSLVSPAPHPLRLREQGTKDVESALKTYYGVSEIKTWASTDQAKAGEVYAQVPASGAGRSYYQLKNETKTPPPADKSSNAQWQYLGDADSLQKLLAGSQDRTAFDAAMVDWYKADRIHRWFEARNHGNVGDLYAQDATETGARHYYRLKLTAYGRFPTPPLSNRSWDYLGKF